jgi:SAM-dependent methyltransferase
MNEGGKGNVDSAVVASFGEEWSRFSNESLPASELAAIFAKYTSNFPWDALPPEAVGFDAGCGSGRWAKLFAPRVGRLLCIDASPAAIEVARRQLASAPNVEFLCSDLNRLDLPAGSFDFGYSLGVLHHVPDTRSAMRACVQLLKPGAPFLVYLYYSMESASLAKRTLFQAVSAVRFGVSRLPTRARVLVCDLLAAVVYWPLARFARLVERAGGKASVVPLSFYRDRSFYVMRNDALDRFGTRLEKRFSRDEVVELMGSSGLESIHVSDDEPYWVAVGRRVASEARG